MEELIVEEDLDVVVGLDIGTTKVVAVVGCKDPATGKIKILGYGKTVSEGVVRGEVFNIMRTTDAVKKAISEASVSSEVDIKEVYVGIAGKHIESFTKKSSFVRTNREDLVTKEEIEAMKKEASMAKVQDGKQILHVIPQTFTVDGVSGIKEDVFIGMTGSNIEVTYNIITADISAMRNLQRCVEMAGLELKGFVLEPLVSAEAVLDANDKEAGTVLVDMGGGTTDIAIFVDGVLCHTSVIPLAGNVITSDVRQGCNILPKQAEALKVKFGSALPSEASDSQIVAIKTPTGRSAKEISLKQLAEIIHARVKEIFGSVTHEIENCACNPESFIGGIVLTGGGAKLKHIDTVCEYISHLDTRTAVPGIHLTSESPKELNDPIFATAIGLLIFGIRDEEENAQEQEPQRSVPPVEEPEREQEEKTPVEPEKPQPQPAPVKPRFIDKVKGLVIKAANVFGDGEDFQ